MNPAQIQEMLRSRKPEQIKEAQKQLRALGLYHGNIDGSLGRNPDESDTQQALNQYQLQYTRQLEQQASQQEAEERARADALRAQELALEAERLRQTGQNQEAENAEAEAKRLRREEYARQETSAEGMTAKGSASIIAPALTTSLGYGLGGKLNERLDKAQAGRNVTLRGAAEDRVKGLTTREGAVTGTKLSGAMPFSNPLMRSTARMAPHLGLASIAFGKGAEHLSGYDEDQPYYSRMADRAAGLGYIGFGAGLGKRGIEYAASPGVSPDAQALSVINSSQLRRNAPGMGTAQPQQSLPPAQTLPQSSPAPSPPAQTPVPTNAQTLIAAARAAGAEGKLTKASAAQYLQKNITDQNRAAIAKELRVSPGPNFVERIGKKIKGLSSSRKTLPGLMWPLGAAAFAYGATPERASASDGGAPSVDQGEALTNAGIAGGLTYGMSRMIPKGSMPLVGGMLGAVPAMGFDPLEGGSREETAQNISDARGQASEYAPWLAENVLGIPRSEGEMYSKAQVPPRNPMRGLPAGADPDVAKAWRSSPRRTIIELSRNSGLDANDIATLAGVAPDEVQSLMGAIPQRAMEMRASP